MKFSLSAAFSLNSAISLSAFALSTVSSLALISALALASAIFAALAASVATSKAKFLTDSVALSIELGTPVKESTKLLPAFFASSNAALKSPEKTFLIALPKNPTVSRIALNLFVIFSTRRFLKSVIAFFGFSNTEIIVSPKLAKTSRMLSTTLPRTARIFLNFF